MSGVSSVELTHWELLDFDPGQGAANSPAKDWMPVPAPGDA